MGQLVSIIPFDDGNGRYKFEYTLCHVTSNSTNERILVRTVGFTTAARNPNDSDVPDECPICQNSFTDKEGEIPQQFELPNCKHIFGHRCLARHMSQGQVYSNKCPLCRTVLHGHSHRHTISLADLLRSATAQVDMSLHLVIVGFPQQSLHPRWFDAAQLIRGLAERRQDIINMVHELENPDNNAQPMAMTGAWPDRRQTVARIYGDDALPPRPDAPRPTTRTRPRRPHPGDAGLGLRPTGLPPIIEPVVETLANPSVERPTAPEPAHLSGYHGPTTRARSNALQSPPTLAATEPAPPRIEHSGKEQTTHSQAQQASFAHISPAPVSGPVESNSPAPAPDNGTQRRPYFASPAESQEIERELFRSVGARIFDHGGAPLRFEIIWEENGRRVIKVHGDNISMQM